MFRRTSSPIGSEARSGQVDLRCDCCRLSNEKVSAPAGLIGRRIWRTEAGRTCPWFLDLAPGAATTSFSDNLPDSFLGPEIAPYQYLGRDLGAAVKMALANYETLKDLGTQLQTTDASLEFADLRDVVSPRRNQRVRQCRATFTLSFNFKTRQAMTEIIP